MYVPNRGRRYAFRKSFGFGDFYYFVIHPEGKAKNFASVYSDTPRILSVLVIARNLILVYTIQKYAKKTKVSR
jgi:hypothetical protein